MLKYRLKNEDKNGKIHIQPCLQHKSEQLSAVYISLICGIYLIYTFKQLLDINSVAIILYVGIIYIYMV